MSGSGTQSNGGAGRLDDADVQEDYAGVTADLLKLLADRGETVAVAESLTGGMVAAELTSAPGSSHGFRGSITAYATDLKERLLGVDAELLAERGAVDAEVARQMAVGVRRALDADWGIATTGVAGPEPQDGQPVGKVFLGVAGPEDRPVARELRLDGDRGTIRETTVVRALTLLLGELTGDAGAKDTEQHGGNGCLQP